MLLVIKQEIILKFVWIFCGSLKQISRFFKCVFQKYPYIPKINVGLSEVSTLRTNFDSLFLNKYNSGAGAQW